MQKVISNKIKERAAQIPPFKCRCSAIGRIMGGNVGLTPKQKERLAYLENRFENPPVIPMAAGKINKLASLLERDGDESKQLTPKQLKDLAQLQHERDNPKRKRLTPNMMDEMNELRHIQNNPELPQGAKTYAKKWYMAKLFNRRKMFTSKETSKGIINEDWAIDFIGDMMDEMFLKNDEFFVDDFIQGTPDIHRHDLDLIIDVKNSWEPDTFPYLETEIPNSDYYYQLQGYMALTGMKKAKLIYVLSNAPDFLIDQAANRERFNLGLPDVTEALYMKHEQAMTFDDLPDEMRIKTFEIERDDDVIREIHERVALCRQYLETIKIK